ncbi:NusG domain II-containing protein [Laribacter hongkongensis]|uniref:NusG domain II-containing protein n=1 Tax=Laribacter hongkongensis TaxID=168471 RepID=UPI001EFDC8AD|nr:NusG domain II-containing protein [Laribacter hongkongensis]MCG9094020.1 NusG domain II-containing protein [Laribacter hongkongensis]
MQRLLPAWRPGDWGLWLTALLLVIASGLHFWRDGIGDTLRIRANGQVFGDYPLRLNRTLDIPGPLGHTTIEIRAGRARIAADPSPRQYCVRHGWLTRPGEMAICLPNRTSIEILRAQRDYDSLGY